MRMISIKKHLDEKREDSLEFTLYCYRTAVSAMAESGARVCPNAEKKIRESLLNLRERLVATSERTAITETTQELEIELEAWATKVNEYYRQKASEVREIMLAMTEAARAVGTRDERYGEEFGKVSQRLQEISELEDISKIRDLVRQTAASLQTSTQAMVSEGQQSVSVLQQQLDNYRQKLAEAERTSGTDALTGLANRMRLEQDIDIRIAKGAPFCLLVLDLNGFKAVNDTYGHSAGDQLLNSFGAELKAQFRPGDPVGRWGGDEFVVLQDCGMAAVKDRVSRVRSWALGEYTIQHNGRPVKVNIDAAIGVAEWAPGKSSEMLFQEADKAMYSQKKSR